MKNESTEKRIKYIVEVPEPATGQVVSSGGIRGKNGRIQAQFTNPKRYRTSSLPARGALPVNDDSKDEQLSLI